MSSFVEVPIIMTLRVEVKPEARDLFVDWQADLNSTIICHEGFISLEFLSPNESEKKWVIVQRLANIQSATAWRDSEIYKKLFENLKKLSIDKTLQESWNEESSLKEGVTEVIVTAVSPEHEKAYLAWSSKIHHAEAKFAGFRGVYVQSPSQSKGGHWITLLQFDTMRNLDLWLDSSERRDLLSESTPFISSLETHRVISPYAGWFASIARVGEAPSIWKETMLILLVLFPIVMLQLKYLFPLLSFLNPALATFIGNALSVTLISFPLMPIAIYFLGWWLAPDNKNRKKWTFLGTLLVLALYFFEILIFWKFL